MNTNNVMKSIAALDLEPIKTKLMHVASGEGWSRAKVDALDVEYRRFLYLTHAFPNEDTAPTVDVDTFWHYHILDTAKYAVDCENTFGYFLHHYPYAELDSAPDDGAEQRGGNRMRELYEQTFGEEYIRAEAYGEQAAQAAYCMYRPDARQAEGAQAAYCMYRDDGVQAKGAQAAYCMYRVDTVKAEGAQAAYCMYRVDARQAAGAQAAYCMYQPDAKRAKGAQSAYCMYRPDARRAEGAQAAYCMYRPDAKRAEGAAAAYCMYRPDAAQSPIRPAIQAAYCMYRDNQAPVRPATAAALAA
jgi:hypothetical protein